MAVAASKVKALCTDSEVALVRASRTPELEKLSAAELKRNVARSRKLFDKWQGQGRTQARTQVRQEGSPDLQSNTKLKAQIFREALDGFEAQAAKLSVTGKPASKNKQSRAAEHRTRRAAVRSGMTAALDVVNTQRQAKKPKQAAKAVVKPAAKVTVKAVAKPAPAAAKPAQVKKPVQVKKAAKPLAKPKKPTTPHFTTSQLAPLTPLIPAKQLKATTAAKQARIAKSGKTTRLIGHTTARGKRSQARRDSKN
jgi:transcriptional regulator with PAS, ATPase and Fis domain